jgi:hypothetical protein
MNMCQQEKERDMGHFSECVSDNHPGGHTNVPSDSALGYSRASKADPKSIME